MSSVEARIAASGSSIHAHRKATRKMRWWYEAMADFMMANPNATQNQIAANFKRGVATVSTIINSDAFKAYMRQRRAEHVASLDASVRDKMLQVADKGFDLILDRFEKKKDTIPLEMIQKTVDGALKGLGFGQTTAPQTVVNVGNTHNSVAVAVSLEDLQSAQKALRNAQNAPSLPPVVDAEFTEVKSTDILDDLA